VKEFAELQPAHLGRPLWERLPLVALLGASLAINVVLATRLRFAPHEDLSSIVHPSLGSSVADFRAVDHTGSPVTLQMSATGSKYTVLYVFTPGCMSCARDLPNLHSLAAQAGRRYRLLAVSLTADQLDAYLKEHDLNFGVYALTGNAAISGLTLTGTPSTFVISSERRVVASWLGAFQKQARSEIERFLDIRLPNL